MKIPRWVGLISSEKVPWSAHTFCDASVDAFSAVIYLRTTQNGKVVVYLLAAKSRVAPVKKLTVPRLELLAATIAVQLCTDIRKILPGNGEYHWWSDLSTVLSLIKRKEEWSVFVRNRILEIRELSSPESWRHVPGTSNPADLPSRGCFPKQLAESKWWEGPPWLSLEPKMWPQETVKYDEGEIEREKKERLVISMINQEPMSELHLTYFSKYTKLLRMIAWIQRFINNTRNSGQKAGGELTAAEIDKAEVLVLRIIQSEAFRDEHDPKWSTLDVLRDSDGVVRVRSRVSNRPDHQDFCFPVVLPAPTKNEIVRSLVYDTHCNSCHGGTQGLQSILRERYWILGGKRSIRSVIASCVKCKRHNAKAFAVESPPLPMDRVRDAAVFEVTGIDFAGPLFLKDGTKAWVCLFTCAVYGAIHLELVSSLSSAAFMQALRRFVARRGRPKKVFSDNGTNFVGVDNAFARLNWREIEQYASVQRIVWNFNPPSAPWWGGFWERLVGVVKQMLRKVLGRAALNFEELQTLLCDCEVVINNRPLTEVSHDSKELIAITPAMFLRERPENGVPECDNVDQNSFNRRIQYLQRLRTNLRGRFRNEYIPRPVEVHEEQNFEPSYPNRRNRADRDGRTRLAKVITTKGQLLRPVQRLFALETVCTEEPACDITSDPEEEPTPESVGGEPIKEPEWKNSAQDSAVVIESSDS